MTCVLCETEDQLCVSAVKNRQNGCGVGSAPEIDWGYLSAANHSAHGGFTDLAMGHSGVVLWPTALRLPNHPVILPIHSV